MAARVTNLVLGCTWDPILGEAEVVWGSAIPSRSSSRNKEWKREEGKGSERTGEKKRGSEKTERRGKGRGRLIPKRTP